MSNVRLSVEGKTLAKYKKTSREKIKEGAQGKLIKDSFKAKSN